ncbi:MAG: hypothetical protein GWN58_18395, partial [Anaerolineae bacterium]|nr:hypothetical protein [Anaerolineae bacterium]
GTHHPELCNTLQAGATWMYNWHSELPSCPGVESVAMVYNEYALNGLQTGYYRMQANSVYIMGFNEPDSVHQADLTPEEAAPLWRELEEMYPGKKLVSPAVVFDLPWLERFREEYMDLYGAPPRLDALAVHCYRNDVASCQGAVEEIAGYAQAWGIDEVWLTEWEFWGEGSVERLLEFVAWLEAHPLVTRYAWFPGTLTGDEAWLEAVPPTVRQRYIDCQLIMPDGTLTQYGRAYAWAH